MNEFLPDLHASTRAFSPICCLQECNGGLTKSRAPSPLLRRLALLVCLLFPSLTVRALRSPEKLRLLLGGSASTDAEPPPLLVATICGFQPGAPGTYRGLFSSRPNGTLIRAFCGKINDALTSDAIPRKPILATLGRLVTSQ